MKKLLIALIIPLVIVLNFNTTLVNNRIFTLGYPAIQQIKEFNNHHTNFIPNAAPVFAAGTVVIEAVAGFTLAEVLIALLIIGVVASLVIPEITQDTQNAELHTA